jgi:cyclic pyranopterin phosphate synthase
LRERLRAGISDQKLLDTIKQVIWNKPKECDLKNGGKGKRGMHRIGG